MPDKRRRRWDALVEDDPLAGLINLFDLWMVFSIALLLSLATFLKLPPAVSGQAAARGRGRAVAGASRSSAGPKKLPHYRVSRDETQRRGRPPGHGLPPEIRRRGLRSRRRRAVARSEQGLGIGD